MSPDRFGGRAADELRPISIEPASSHSTTWKPPNPGSTAPLPLCSPLIGKSSSNTKMVSVAVFIGLAWALTVTGAKVHVPVAVQVGAAIGAPAIVCPQLDAAWPVGVELAAQLAATLGSDPFPVLNALAASPGRIDSSRSQPRTNDSRSGTSSKPALAARSRDSAPRPARQVSTRSSC